MRIVERINYTLGMSLRTRLCFGPPPTTTFLKKYCIVQQWHLKRIVEDIFFSAHRIICSKVKQFFKAYKGKWRTFSLHLWPCCRAICWDRGYRETCAATHTSPRKLIYCKSFALLLSCKARARSVPSHHPCRILTTAELKESSSQSSEDDISFSTKCYTSDQHQSKDWLEI